MILKPGRWVAQALQDARFQTVAQSVSKEAADGQTTVLPLLQRM